MLRILTALLDAIQANQDTILCSVIGTSGSTPRGSGAQMLVGCDGLLQGTIGGGSVEAAACANCLQLLRERKSDLQMYHLHAGEKDTLGMVCGGEITVLFLYIPAASSDWQHAAAEAIHRIQTRRFGYLLLPLQDGSPAIAEDVFCGDGYIPLPLPIGERAIIFGAGHCSVALSPLLQRVGFRVTVMDNRPELADPRRFPGADAVICGDFDRIADYLKIDGNDYAVVMTNGHLHDFTVQSQLLRSPLAYIGVIGSRHKTAAVNEMLRQRGISESAIASVHTPIGMAIKAVTPEEIAVSIAGEMILIRATRREENGTLHHKCPMH